MSWHGQVKEGRRVNRVICCFGKTVINMTNGALCVTVRVLTDQQCSLASITAALLLHLCVIFHIDSCYWVRNMKNK